MLRFRRFRWSAAAVERYKPDAEHTWARISRQVLLAGSRGVPIAFDVRYFEIAPRGHSSLETHEHAHVIIVIRGQGEVRVGRRWRELRRFDVCYVGPRKAHQLRNAGGGAFGFLCLVDAERDTATPLLARHARRQQTERD